MVKISMVSKMNIPCQIRKIALICNMFKEMACFSVYAFLILRYIQK
jgi:hypothetical protein